MLFCYRTACRSLTARTEQLFSSIFKPPSGIDIEGKKNNNTNICKAHNVSIRAESESPIRRSANCHRSDPSRSAFCRALLFTSILRHQRPWRRYSFIHSYRKRFTWRLVLSELQGHVTMTCMRSTECQSS